MLFEDTSGNQQPDLNNHSLDTSADDAGPSSSMQHVVSKGNLLILRLPHSRLVANFIV
jgi:hypothetical protein